MTAPEPRRGEVWTVNFSPGRGSEQHSIRPALIIQNDVGNEYAATTIVAAITSKLKVYPVTVPLKRGDAGLRQSSMVNLAQILTVDKATLRRRIGKLSIEKISQVDAAIRVSLDVE